MDPIEAVAFGSNIAANLVTDLLKIGGKRFLNQTRLGTRIRLRMGFIDESSQDQIRSVLLESYEVYFTQKYPERQFQLLYDFFQAPSVTESIFDSIFNFREINYNQLEEKLRSQLNKHYLLQMIFERLNLTSRNVVDDFIACYHEVEASRIGLPILVVIRELRTIESRLAEFMSSEVQSLLHTTLVDLGITADFITKMQQINSDLLTIDPTQILRQAIIRTVDNLPSAFTLYSGEQSQQLSNYTWDEVKGILEKYAGNIAEDLSMKHSSEGVAPRTDEVVEFLTNKIHEITGLAVDYEDARRIACSILAELGQYWLVQLHSLESDDSVVIMTANKAQQTVDHFLVNSRQSQLLIEEKHSERNEQSQQLLDRLSAFRPLDSLWLQESLESEENIHFYKGYRATWADIVRGRDVRRDILPEVYQTAKQRRGNRTAIIVLSHMGGGKTTFIRRLAYELYLGGEIVLYNKGTHLLLNVDELRDLARNSDMPNPFFLFIDDAARVSNLEQFLEALADYGIKAIVIMSSRTGEWAEQHLAFTGNLDYPPQMFQLPSRLSDDEISLLSLKLSELGISGNLRKFSGDELLVMMIQLTGGEGFEQIIRKRIQMLSRTRKMLTCYEYVCLLNQYDIAVPVQLLAVLLDTKSIHRDYFGIPALKEILIIEWNDAGVYGPTVTAGHELITTTILKHSP